MRVYIVGQLQGGGGRKESMIDCYLVHKQFWNIKKGRGIQFSTHGSREGDNSVLGWVMKWG